jgi:AcrR family transcriptional regulator
VGNDNYHHGYLRETLIDEACKQIEQDGATALNLSQLAKKIGVSQPAVYRHFPNKQALAMSVAEKGFKQLTENLQQAIQPIQGDVFESISGITTAYVEFALHHPELARLMFSMKERVNDPTLHDISKAAAAPLFGIVENAKSQDSLRNQDIDKTVRIIWATIHGLAMLLIDDQMPLVSQSDHALTDHIEATAQSLYYGLFICSDS